MVKFIVTLGVLAFSSAALGESAKSENKTSKEDRTVMASCVAPAVKLCATCSIACPVGKAAYCYPGHADENICKRDPRCLCKDDNELGFFK